MLRGCRGRALAYLFLCISAPAAWGLEPGRRITQYPARSWTVDQGLPQNTVNVIRQTRDGYVWLGTEAGLARFDGMRFTVFTAADTEALPDGYVNALLEDRQGRLWIGSWEGLTVYHHGRFERFAELSKISNSVFSLHESQSGVLWFGTSRGLVRYDGSALKTFGAESGLQKLHVRAIVEEQDGTLWVGTDGGGLARLDGERFTTFTTRDGLPDDIVWRLLVDRRGELWAATYRGLARRRGARFEAVRGSGLPSVDLRALWEDKNGNLWIGARGGVTRVSGGREGPLLGEGGMGSDLVISFFEDRDGNVPRRRRDGQPGRRHHSTRQRGDPRRVPGARRRRPLRSQARRPQHHVILRALGRGSWVRRICRSRYVIPSEARDLPSPSADPSKPALLGTAGTERREFHNRNNSPGLNGRPFAADRFAAGDRERSGQDSG